MAGCWVELEVFANVRPNASGSRDSRLRRSTHKNPNLVLPLALSVRPSVRLCVCLCTCLCVSLDPSLCEFSEVICKVCQFRRLSAFHSVVLLHVPDFLESTRIS
jgi:hypothetical protein